MPLLGNHLLRKQSRIPALWRDRFLTDVAATIPSGRLAEPGVGAFTRSNAANASITNKRLILAAESGGFTTPTFNRAAGRSFIGIARKTGGNYIGADRDNGYAGFNFRTSNGLGIGNIIDEIMKVSNNTDYQFDSTDRTAGSLNLLRGGSFSDWILWYVDCIRSSASPSSGVSSFDGSGEFADLGLYDLGATWEASLKTVDLPGARSAGETFTHFADFSLDFTVTTLPASANLEFRWRIVDASNYMQLLISSGGVATINQVVAGSPTTLATTGAVIANGDRVFMPIYGSTVMLVEGAVSVAPHTRRVNITTATNFQTATGGQLVSLGTGGAISNVIIWPYKVNSVTAPLAVATLNRAAPSFP